MKTSLVVNIVFLIYVVILIGIGVVAHKRVKKSEDFSAEYWVGGDLLVLG